MTNAILLDTLIRAEGGASECTGNPNVIRNPVPEDTVDWAAAGLCPAGLVEKVNAYYVNGDTRTIEGFELESLLCIH